VVCLFSKRPLAPHSNDEQLKTSFMKNPKWNKQTDPHLKHLLPVTEDELDAYRFRGTPIRRRIPGAGSSVSPQSSSAGGDQDAAAPDAASR
jgi:hypothetical protein